MSSTESVFSEQMIGEWTLKCPECSTVIQHLLKIMERITVLFYWKSESVRNSVMSNSLWHRGLEPTRLLCPWNSPGKNTGVGCHSLLQGIFLTQQLSPHTLHCKQILYLLSHLQFSSVQSLSCIWLMLTPLIVAHQAALSMEFSRQDTGVDSHFLLQGIFLTQGLNSCLLHCRQMFYHVSHQEDPSSEFISTLRSASGYNAVPFNLLRLLMALV